MRGSEASIRNDLETRLAELERANPEWRSWLRVVRETAPLLEAPAWAAARLDVPAQSTPPGAPLLHGRVLRLGADQLRSLVSRLAEIAALHAAPAGAVASLARYRPSAAEAVALLQTAVRQEARGIDAIAATAGVDAGALAALARLAALPVLLACARHLRDELPAHWPHGYCPTCGAWPTLVELRGLDRARCLRCGRCGGDWRIPWLCCPYCGEAEHTRLGSLVPEQQVETYKVETCANCQGYLKSVATLRAASPIELLLRDLETVELDLAAVEREYARPDGPGYALDLRVLPAD
jgi:FdhE protein